MGNESQDSAAEDLELLISTAAKAPEDPIDSKVFTPMNKEQFDFMR